MKSKVWLVVVMCLAPLVALYAGEGNKGFDPADPLTVAMAVADNELYGTIQEGMETAPQVKVHHDLLWEDGTLMSGVAALYDREEELGTKVPRYIEYIKAWADRPMNKPVPIGHGDQVCAGETYVWLYEKLGKSTPYLKRTDPLITFIFTGRKFSQYPEGYYNYWMRFWNDDTHMVPPFLARRGRAVGDAGMWNGRDGRKIAMEYLRAYTDVLQDKSNGLFWHDPRSIGQYQWGRGNGWVAAGMTKVKKQLDGDPAYAADIAWINEQLTQMAKTLKDNRNNVGTWNADVLNRETYTEPETSGSAFFTYMMAAMINRGELGDEYIPVVLKSWRFLVSSVTPEGKLLRCQPVGRGPITDDFSQHTATYAIGGFLLAATEISKFPPEVLNREVE